MSLQFHRREFLAAAAAASMNSLPVCAQQEPAATGTRWPDERQVGPFYVHADFDLRRIDQPLRQTAALQWDLERSLQVGKPREAIHLMLFAKRDTFRAYVSLYFPDVPQRRALYIKNGRGPGMVFAHLHEDVAVDLRHECTHALLHSVLPMVPLWLDEGIAEYFEVEPDLRAYDNPHLSHVKWRAKLGAGKKIESLESVDKLAKMGAAEYRYAWAWVHYMLHGDQSARSELTAYLRDIAAHTPPGKLSSRLRRRDGRLDQKFLAHLASWHRPA